MAVIFSWAALHVQLSAQGSVVPGLVLFFFPSFFFFFSSILCLLLSLSRVLSVALPSSGGEVGRNAAVRDFAISYRVQRFRNLCGEVRFTVGGAGGRCGVSLFCNADGRPEW